jgi:hypothetical protein
MTAVMRGCLGHGTEEGTERRGGSIGRDLSSLRVAGLVCDEHGGWSGEALPSSESAPSPVAGSSSKAMGAAEPSESELASEVRECGLGLLLASLRAGEQRWQMEASMPPEGGEARQPASGEDESRVWSSVAGSASASTLHHAAGDGLNLGDERRWVPRHSLPFFRMHKRVLLETALEFRVPTWDS